MINPKLKSPKAVISWAITLLTPVILCACEKVDGPEKTDNVEKKEAVENEQQVFKVPIVIAQSIQQFDQIEIPGVVTALPDHSVKVSPAIAGKLTAILVVPGSKVKKNEIIAWLDDTHLRDQLSQSKTAVDTANVALKQAKNSLDFAEENLQRQKKLYDAEVSAKKDIIAAENQVMSARSQVETAQSQVRTAQTVVKQNETEIAFTKVHSPIAGVVANRFLNTGDSVDPNNPILQVVDLNKVIVNAQIPVESVQSVIPGESAAVFIDSPDSHSNLQLTATITVISPAVDAQTNTVRVQLECDNTAQLLKDSERVVVKVKEKVAHGGILLPKTALVPDPDDPKKQMVYVVENGKAHRTSVTEKEIGNDKVEILSGLKSGQKVIAKDAYGLPEQSTVEEAGSTK